MFQHGIEVQREKANVYGLHAMEVKTRQMLHNMDKIRAEWREVARLTWEAICSSLIGVQVNTAEQVAMSLVQDSQLLHFACHHYYFLDKEHEVVLGSATLGLSTTTEHR